MGETASTQELALRYFSQMREMYGDTLYLKEDPLLAKPFKRGSLVDFESAICECQKCPLGRTRTKFVFGVGHPQAKVVFVGEAPGRDEDLKGEPFVGRAGHLLDRILAAIHVTRDQVYICNILKCRPPENRTPATNEIESCLPYLEEQIEMIQPRLVVALGATAAHTLLKVKTALGQLRSRLWKWREYDLVVTYHPAALLRSPHLKRAAWEDFQWIERIMES